MIGTKDNGQPFVEPTSGRFNVLIKPEKWLTYSLGALTLQQGYRSLDQLIANGTAENSAFWQLVEFCQEELGRNFVGRIWAHEAIFDWGFVHAMETRHHNLPSEFFFGKRCDWSCSKFLFRRLAALGVVPNMPEVHLKTVAAHYGIDFPVEHEALPDTLVAIKCLEAIMQDEFRYYMKRPLDVLHGIMTKPMAGTAYRALSKFEDALSDNKE